MVAAGFISLFIAVLMPDPDEEEIPVIYPGGSSPGYHAPVKASPPISVTRTPPPVSPPREKQDEAAPRRVHVPIEVRKITDEE
jgi:hypothetical protein